MYTCIASLSLSSFILFLRFSQRPLYIVVEQRREQRRERLSPPRSVCYALLLLLAFQRIMHTRTDVLQFEEI